ncbi:MAG: polyprenyl synthetase family protein [Bacteroidales bacterium]
MLSLEDARLRIEQKLKETSFPEKPELLYDPVKYILSNGGKRIRPALVLLGANVFTDDIDPALDPAISVEIFHNFTLLHDDLMDNSKIRRGRATVHEKWNPNIAILSGDAMSIIANQFVSKVKAEILPDVLEVFNRTAVEVCEGQMMDMAFEEREDVTVDEYIRMIELKTSVLIAASLQIGAFTGGANKTQAFELYEFGRLLGIAFQLQDDLLDSYGDTEKFGKKVGNDILTNKKTYLMISAMERSNEEDRVRLKDWLNKENFDPEEKVREIKKIFDNCSIKELTLQKIKEYFDAALNELDKIDVPDVRKKVLRDFSDNLMKREM